MTRPAWKGPFFHKSLLDAATSKTAIDTKQRSSTIIPQFVGCKFRVHNGKEFVPVTIREEMIGLKLGQLAPTKKRMALNSKGALK